MFQTENSNVDGRAATLKLVSDYIILDATDASDIDDINLRDLKDLLDDGAVEIDVVLDAANSNYVQMVIVRDVIK